MSNPNINVSRVVIYKHVSVSAKVRHDLMDSTFSSIWIEIQLPKNKNFLLCHLYREHQYLRQSDDNSLSPEEQLSRWSVFLQQWERALETNLESVVMGDTNVDHFLINSQDLSKSRHKPFINLLSEKIFPYGVKQCVASATHVRPGAKESLLDVCYTNDPERLFSVKVVPRGSSEQRMIVAMRSTKTSQIKNRYIKKRSYTNFDENIFLSELKKCKWWDIYETNEVDVAVDLFTEKISIILDQMAPIKIFQTKVNFVPWLSKTTKEKIS